MCIITLGSSQQTRTTHSVNLPLDNSRSQRQIILVFVYILYIDISIEEFDPGSG